MKTRCFTDLHQHVLWGLDDGPRTPEEMYAMLEQAVGNQIALIAATTHAYPRFQPFDLDLYRQRLAEANAYCRSQGWPIQLVEGCEIHYCDSVPDLLTAGKLPTLGNSRYVLVEFSEKATLRTIGNAADRLYRAGYQPIVAHVERCRCLVRSPGTAMRFKDEYGLLYQMDCDTFLHPRGLFQWHFVRKMLDKQAIDLLATDAHDTKRRPIRMRKAYLKLRKRYDRRYARQLVCFGRRLVQAPEAENNG